VIDRNIALLLLSMLPLATGGCVTAGLAIGGPVISSIVAVSDRSVERTIPADLPTTWAASADALARMALRIEKAEKGEGRWQMTGSAGDVTVHATLDRVTAQLTKVSVRVEAGGLFADKRTGEELLNQVGVSLAGLSGSGPLGATAAAEASAARLDVLHQAIERLAAKVTEATEAREPRRPATGPDPSALAPPAVATPTPIITIPASAGVATVSAPPTVPQPRAIPAIMREERKSTETDRQRLPVAEPAPDIMAKPLHTVDTLKPVEGLMVGPAGR
jgi:hypothetical protein